MESAFPGARDSGMTTLVDAVTGPPPVGDPRLLGRRLEGRYEILRPIDRGGMATVYLALDHRLDREVAVKVMHATLAHDPAFVGRFRREAKAAASIRHRNVVAVTDAGEDRELVYLVMDLVRGRTLRTLLTERGPLPPGRALELTEAILAGLAAAHAGGLVHRDVKPENVLLGDDGTLAVADFGLARAVEASSLTTHAGLLVGTVAYVSPEQVAHGTADARSDVYAAGIVLFEMLTGRVPYDAATPVAVAYRHVHERVPAPSTLVGGIPSEVDDLVLAATAVDPAERFADATGFLAAVQRVRRTLPPARDTIVLPPTGRTVAPVDRGGTVAVRREPPSGGPATARRRRRRWPWVLAVLVLLSAGAGLGGWQLARDARTHIPALQDRSLSAVEDTLTAHHLTYQVAAGQHSDSVPTGEVITTMPAPGAAVKRHATVVIVPSSGVLMLTVPTLTGRTEAAAKAALASAGFPTPTIAGAYSDTVATGTVVAATPTAGTSVSHLTVPVLTLSLGPTPVAIPDESGQSLADARQTLTSLGLKPAVSQAYSTTVPAGTVISASPSGGTGHHGDTVKLVVSKGPQLVAVPGLTQYDGDQAATVLRQLGLVPKEDALFGIHGGAVVTQSPKAGSMVPPGTTVTFYTAY